MSEYAVSEADKAAIRYLVNQVSHEPLREVLRKHGFPNFSYIPLTERPAILEEMLDAAVEALK